MTKNTQDVLEILNKINHTIDMLDIDNYGIVEQIKELEKAVLAVGLMIATPQSPQDALNAAMEQADEFCEKREKDFFDSLIEKTKLANTKK